MRYPALGTAIGIVLLGVGRVAAAQTSQVGPAPAAEIRQLITTYTLLEVGGKSLPTLIEQEWRCHKDIIAGTLVLSGGGRWLLQTVTREVCGDQTMVNRSTDDGIYRTEAGTMHLFDAAGRERTAKRGWSFGTDIDLEELKTGTFGSEGTLTVRLSDGHTELVFRQVVHRVTPPASHRQRPRGAPIKIATAF
ncbi:MAG TPA: hypothetical protein VH680_01930 [Gemmatimonadales bacterium]|jgi:hypothetical protein